MRSAIRCMVLCVWGLVIAGGAQAAPLDHVVFVGDSITFGAHGDPVDHSLNRFSAYVGRRLRVNEQNLGRNGGTAVEFAAHADFLDYQLHSSSILVIMLGSNDQRFIEAPLPDFRAAYRLIVSKALRVICITPTPRFDDAQINSNGDTLDDFRQVVREECTGVMPQSCWTRKTG